MIARSTADAARVLAMGAVLAIHASEVRMPGLVASHDPWSADGLAGLINQAARFCVPMFLLLSGYGLACRERLQAAKAGADPRLVRAWPFYADRLARLALPFALWSLAYRLIDAPWSQGAGTALAWAAGALPRDLATGSAQYHLYFVAIILQCYLLFPLLARLRSRWWLAGSFALGLIYAAPAHELLAAAGLARPELPSWACPAWLCWFHLGVVAGLAPPKPAPARGPATAALAIALAALLAEWWWNSWRMSDPGWFGHFNRWAIFAWVLACWWALRAWDGAIAARLAPPRAGAALAWLSAISFAVYLAHPLLLRGLLALGWTHPLLLIPALVAGAVGGASLIALALRPAPRLARAIGW